MIQMRTILEVADNSGARKLSCILPLGGRPGATRRLGDVITANVKESVAGGARGRAQGQGGEGGDRALRKEQRRRDGTYIRFD